MKIKRYALLLATPIALASCVLASEPGRFDRTLSVTGPVSIDVSSGPGGVDITVGPTNTVVVHAVIRAAFGRADLGLAEANIRALEQSPPVEQSGNRIRIGYVKDEALLKGVSVTYEIQTPEDTQVQAAADAGGLHIDGVQGPVETTNDAGRSEVTGVKAAIKMTTRAGEIVVRNAGGKVFLHNESGGIELMGAQGPVEAQTANGRIEVSTVSGDVNATTQSASIRLHDVKGSVRARNRSGSIEDFGSGGAIDVETVSGAIRISQGIAAPIRALSRSGAIRVELAQGGGYNLNARSEKGKISGSALEASPRTKDQHNFREHIGIGGPLVDLETHSSKIEIK